MLHCVVGQHTQCYRIHHTSTVYHTISSQQTLDSPNQKGMASTWCHPFLLDIVAYSHGSNNALAWVITSFLLLISSLFHLSINTIARITTPSLLLISSLFHLSIGALARITISLLLLIPPFSQLSKSALNREIGKELFFQIIPFWSTMLQHLNVCCPISYLLYCIFLAIGSHFLTFCIAFS